MVIHLEAIQTKDLPYFNNACVVSRKAVVFVDDAFGGDLEDTISRAFDLVVTLDAGEVFGDEFADRRIFFHICLGNRNGLELLHGAFHQRAVLFRFDGADDAVHERLRQEEHADVQYIVAHGIATSLKGKRVVIGSKHFVIEDEKVNVSEANQAIIDEQAGAASVIYLGIGGELAGAICIGDPPREEAADAIRGLRESGIKNVVMLTGDSLNAAERVAEHLGIDTFFAQVLPEDKHHYVERMKAEGKRVIMVGDGINDAPALAAANVSVAMSDASDIARETADVTLRRENLEDLVELRLLSQKLMERISENYRFIVVFNTSLLVGGFFGLLSPTTSALLHNVSTMGICAKSMTKLKVE